MESKTGKDKQIFETLSEKPTGKETSRKLHIFLTSKSDNFWEDLTI